jgi:hypothetical protein
MFTDWFCKCFEIFGEFLITDCFGSSNFVLSEFKIRILFAISGKYLRAQQFLLLIFHLICCILLATYRFITYGISGKYRLSDGKNEKNIADLHVLGLFRQKKHDLSEKKFRLSHAGAGERLNLFHTYSLEHKT